MELLPLKVGKFLPLELLKETVKEETTNNLVAQRTKNQRSKELALTKPKPKLTLVTKTLDTKTLDTKTKVTTTKTKPLFTRTLLLFTTKTKVIRTLLLLTRTKATKILDTKTKVTRTLLLFITKTKLLLNKTKLKLILTKPNKELKILLNLDLRKIRKDQRRQTNQEDQTQPRLTKTKLLPTKTRLLPTKTNRVSPFLSLTT